MLFGYSCWRNIFLHHPPFWADRNHRTLTIACHVASLPCYTGSAPLSTDKTIHKVTEDVGLPNLFKFLDFDALLGVFALGLPILTGFEQSLILLFSLTESVFDLLDFFDQRGLGFGQESFVGFGRFDLVSQRTDDFVDSHRDQVFDG